MVAVVTSVPLGLEAVNLTVTDSGVPFRSAVSALCGSLIVTVKGTPALTEPRLVGSESVLWRFLPCLGLITSVSLPFTVMCAVWSQRTTNETVPGLRLVLALCRGFLAGGRSTAALLARIVHDGAVVAVTTAVGAELAGWLAPAALDAVSTSRMV